MTPRQRRSTRKISRRRLTKVGMPSGTVTLFAVALLLSACYGIQPTPVAPSPTAPAPTSQPTPTPAPVPSFSVSVNANGEVAYVNEVWNTTLVVTSSDPSAGPPASVVFDCGSGIGERVLFGFIGQISVSCTFAAAGQYTVRASVVFQNAVTTATVPLTALTRPTSSARKDYLPQIFR
jgi:hypothetical protein